MIPKECKRLAEVDFPIAVVSKHSAREKSIRHGHPSTLHLWWARRPLAACRAMLMALLLPDPEDQHCPAEFKTAARSLLAKMAGKIGAKDTDLRTALLRFIGDFADWDNSGNRTYLEVGRGLVMAAHPEETPLVADPFAGGGSIPLEALRLGCDAFASDLNPVACLINKVLLEDIPRHGQELAEELRRVGTEVKKAAETELAEFYPRDTDGARPIAYLWARTVRCEAPNCGAEIPLMRSFWLCKKAERRRALRTNVVRPTKAVPRVEFELFTPESEADVRGGTVSRAKAVCICCQTVLHPDRVRAQLCNQRGGADVVFDSKGNREGGARLLAVVTAKAGETGRRYRLATDNDYTAVYQATNQVRRMPHDSMPIEEIPPTELRRISVPLYGMTTWGDIFTSRQKAAIVELLKQIAKYANSDNRNRLMPLLALAVSRCTEQLSSLVRWRITVEAVAGTFGRQALGMMWDFAEIVPAGDDGSNFAAAFEWVAEVAQVQGSGLTRVGSVQQADAANSPLPDDGCGIWFTDPPYYDSVPYAHLSDYFYVWLRRSLITALPQLFDSATTPKEGECVVDRPHSKSKTIKTAAYYEQKLASCMRAGRRVLAPDGIGAIVFAHKTTEGWEALLSAIIAAGWTIRASWPIATERSARLNAQDTAALATSVHLVCRPRPDDAGIGDWGQVLRELPKRVADWMTRLQGEGVRGADLVFACIGPSLEVFSRYSKVVDAQEREIPLGGNPEAREAHQRGFLAYVWEVVGRAALEEVLGTAESRARNGGAGALEEDARLTALFLWTLQATTQEAEPVVPADEDAEDAETDEQDEDDAPTSKKKKKGLSLPFDVARRFAQPLGIHLDAWEGRCIETEKGIVRLVPVLDRATQLFGDDGAEAVADRLEKVTTGPLQGTLFPVENDPPATPIKGRKRKGGATVSDESLHKHRGATTLDHVHAAMLLQSAGRANALRALLKTETERGPDFLRLANALSALYPTGSDEKRLLDAMLLAVPR